MTIGIDNVGYSYLGQTVVSPITLINGSATLVLGVPSVIQSILFALNTPKGSLFMRPEYGSRIHLLLFQPNDDVLQDLGKLYIQECIRENEKRVAFVDSKFQRSDSNASFIITYRILSSNELGVLTYPFNKF
jgi:phage baseplate assembly protein W